MSDQPRLTTVPITLATCARIVTAWHRHHGPTPPSLTWFCLGAVREDTGDVVGVAVVGRPANRNSDDGQTGEVLRVATDGTPNACSVLYGACAAAARRMGFARIITYTLESEPGTSLRASGWSREADGIESMWARYPGANRSAQRTVVPRDHYDVRKIRWGIDFRPPIGLVLPMVDVNLPPSLFDDEALA